jgi:putative tryptophan/tyrosine transport system substrate-binding protein
LRMEVRWAGDNIDRIRAFAKELVDSHPDLILAQSTPVTAALQRETRTIPIVFVIVVDPVGRGFVKGLPHPGGNITGFINAEASMAGKWLEFLMEIAPGTKRAAAMFNPDTAPYGQSYLLPSFEAAAHSLKVEPIPAAVHDAAEIEKVIGLLGHGQPGGLVVMADNFMFIQRSRIISLAAENKVPAVYFTKVFARDGGLLSYGSDQADIYYRAAPYVDRILRGANPADLPVQLPIKFETFVNMKTAEALGLTVPQSILLLADEVIE